jgi:hypothetical protein
LFKNDHYADRQRCTRTSRSSGPPDRRGENQSLRQRPLNSIVLEPNMRVPVNPRRETRLAVAVLAMFWLGAALILLLGWRIPALVLLLMGLAAASERLFRIVSGSNSSKARVVAGCTWVALVVTAVCLAFLVQTANFPRLVSN